MRWDQQRVMVSRGASLIGSALLDALFSRKKGLEIAAILGQVPTERTAKLAASRVDTTG